LGDAARDALKSHVRSTLNASLHKANQFVFFLLQFGTYIIKFEISVEGPLIRIQTSFSLIYEQPRGLNYICSWVASVEDIYSDRHSQ
jgi:hypothetical protein